MLEKYKYLNTYSKKFLIDELRKIIHNKQLSKEIFDRCCMEMDLLYDKGVLFIVDILYKFKKQDGTSYHFRGMINNLLLMYVLGISDVDPVKYNLPYELLCDFDISVDLINDYFLSLVWFIEKEYNTDLKIIYGTYEVEDMEELNLLECNHFLLIPNNIEDEVLYDLTLKLNDDFLFETVEDYRNYKNEFLTIRIDEKDPIRNYKNISLENVFTCDFEKEIAKILKPKTINDYIKVKSIGHGTNVWNNNQDILVKEEKINLNNLIATREDILEYLLNHSIDRDEALEIVNFIRKGKQKKEPKKWNEYVKIMKKNNCEDMFIDIFSKIEFIFGRGQAVSECLFVLNKGNYIEK